VIDFVNEQMDNTTKLFVYSVGIKAAAEDDDDDNLFAKRLACATDGVWSRFDGNSNSSNNTMDLTTTAYYYDLFTLGRSNAPSENFTTWVEPYEFSTGRVLGTTVSAPVYDRSRNPPLLLGVVGMDVTMNVLDRTLGEPSAQQLRDEVRRSQANWCPTLKWDQCQLENFRGSGANCTANCTIDADMNSDAAVRNNDQLCPPTTDDFPTVLWAPTDPSFGSKDYRQRVCCKDTGDTAPADTCDNAAVDDDDVDVDVDVNSFRSSNLFWGLIVGLVLAGLVIVMLVAGIVWKFSRVPREETIPVRLVDLTAIRPQDGINDNHNNEAPLANS
jgi:hypothetical protein